MRHYAATIADLRIHARVVVQSLQTERAHYAARGNTVLVGITDREITRVLASLDALSVGS